MFTISVILGVLIFGVFIAMVRCVPDSSIRSMNNENPGTDDEHEPENLNSKLR